MKLYEFINLPESERERIYAVVMDKVAEIQAETIRKNPISTQTDIYPLEFRNALKYK